ncbi:MAG: hypothetical protein ABI237_00430 [Ginsengibacter sp.]
MKIMYKVMLLCIIVMFSYSSTQAQILTSNRQNYFGKYAEKLPTAVTELEKAFSTPEGAKIKINFSDFSFNGIVTSSIKRYDNLYSVLVKAPGLDNTLLALSKRINDDKTITYIGRIINENYADGFELREGKDGTYAMNKIKTDAMIEDY